MLSVGLALWREPEPGRVEVLLGHMGGPFFSRRHEGAWSFPKGLIDEAEDPLAAAEREFTEELGSPPPPGRSVDLGSVRRSGKTFQIFARAGDFDETSAVSNTFELEWPRGSGRIQNFPEIDRAAWVALDDAETWLTKGLAPFVERLRGIMD